MSKLYITEFWGQGSDNGGRVSPSPKMPPVAEQVIVFGVVAVDSAPINNNTKLIRVHADGICSITIGPPGNTATAAALRLSTNQTEYFSVTGGHVVSVIQNS